jgi:GNAT superfamily N-acetyltransferase
VIRRATSADIEPVSEALARAFYDDPVIRWMLPSDRRRLTQARRFFRARMRQLLHHDGVFTSDDRAGAALWAPPGAWEVRLGATLQLAAPLLPSLVARLPRALRGLSLVEAEHPREPEHWYLAVLGTDPSRQGEGIGSALLQPVLDSCDADGVPAYLESSKERNVDFYSRFGFRVTTELRLPKGPPLWPMWREPRGASAPPS